MLSTLIGCLLKYLPFNSLLILVKSTMYLYGWANLEKILMNGSKISENFLIIMELVGVFGLTKKMNSGSCITTYDVPPHWNEIVVFANKSRDFWLDVYADRPIFDDINASIEGLKSNILYNNQKINWDFCKALGYKGRDQIQ